MTSDRQVEVMNAHKKLKESVVVLQTTLRQNVPKYNTLLLSKELERLLRKVEALHGAIQEVF